jgi:hypothetical protein
MSTGLECEFIRTPEDTWYYALQDWDCPVGAWDWREYASAYGPFATQEEATTHLDHNHANPGGWMVHDNKDNKPIEGEWAKLIKAAHRPVARVTRW